MFIAIFVPSHVRMCCDRMNAYAVCVNRAISAVSPSEFHFGFIRIFLFYVPKMQRTVAMKIKGKRNENKLCQIFFLLFWLYFRYFFYLLSTLTISLPFLPARTVQFDVAHKVSPKCAYVSVVRAISAVDCLRHNTVTNDFMIMAFWCEASR